jgi:hypothetical protein
VPRTVTRPVTRAFTASGPTSLSPPTGPYSMISRRGRPTRVPDAEPGTRRRPGSRAPARAETPSVRGSGRAAVPDRFRLRGGAFRPSRRRSGGRGRRARRGSGGTPCPRTGATVGWASGAPGRNVSREREQVAGRSGSHAPPTGRRGAGSGVGVSFVEQSTEPVPPSDAAGPVCRGPHPARNQGSRPPWSCSGRSTVSVADRRSASSQRPEMSTIEA